MTKHVGDRSVEERRRRAEIQVIVGQVENLKQIHLSVEESIALVNALDRTGRSVEQIREMGIRVAMNPDYGRIPFDVWLSATPLYTEEDVARLVEQRIRDRIWLTRHLRVDPEEAKRIAETNIQAEYSRQLQVLIDKEANALRQRNRHARAWYCLQSSEVQLEILKEGERRKLLRVDAMVEKYRTTDYVVLLLMPVIEEKMRQMPEGGPDPCKSESV